MLHSVFYCHAKSPIIMIMLLRLCLIVFNRWRAPRHLARMRPTATRPTRTVASRPPVTCGSPRTSEKGVATSGGSARPPRPGRSPQSRARERSPRPPPQAAVSHAPTGALSPRPPPGAEEAVRHARGRARNPFPPPHLRARPPVTRPRAPNRPSPVEEAATHAHAGANQPRPGRSRRSRACFVPDPPTAAIA